MDDQNNASQGVVDGGELVMTSSQSSCDGGGTTTGAVSASPEKKKKKEKKGTDGIGLFFYALLFIWFLSVIWKVCEGQTNLWPVIAGCIFFETVNRILSSLVVRPAFLSGLQAKNVDNFINTALSLLHSSSVAFVVVGLLVLEGSRTSMSKMWTHEVLTGKTWPGAFAVLGASCGYSAYDQWDMLRRRLYKPQSPSLLIHHAVLLTCFTLALFKNSCINYLVLTLVCEVHSIFLHLRRVSLLAGASRKWNFSISLEWTFNWLAFFTTRIVLHVFITLKLLVDFNKFSSGVELPLALMGMAGLNVLNFNLGQGLYKAYLRERAGKLPTSKDAED